MGYAVSLNFNYEKPLSFEWQYSGSFSLGFGKRFYTFDSKEVEDIEYTNADETEVETYFGKEVTNWDTEASIFSQGIMFQSSIKYSPDTKIEYYLSTSCSYHNYKLYGYKNYKKQYVENGFSESRSSLDGREESVIITNKLGVEYYITPELIISGSSLLNYYNYLDYSLNPSNYNGYPVSNDDSEGLKIRYSLSLSYRIWK